MQIHNQIVRDRKSINKVETAKVQLLQALHADSKVATPNIPAVQLPNINSNPESPRSQQNSEEGKIKLKLSEIHNSRVGPLVNKVQNNMMKKERF